MAVEASALKNTCCNLRPHLAMILVQVASAFLYFVTEAAFNDGMNPHVYVTYRHIVGGLVVLPFAYFVERKIRPKMTLALFMELFLSSLLGVGLTVNMYFASLKYTSPAFVSATVNTIPSLTFILAVISRLEALDLRESRGSAKLIGTVVSLAGVLVLTLYRGPTVKCLWSSALRSRTNVFHQDWAKGSILCVASCVGWSIWFIMQGFLLKRYPAQLSLAMLTNFIGAAQSSVFTAIVLRHEPVKWSYLSSTDLGAIFFGGVVSSGLNTSMLIWCTKVKGPVFVTMFSPLQTLLVVIFGYLILSERIYMGSILGGAIIITGLYLLLWGKAGDAGACAVKVDQEQPHDVCCTEKMPQLEAAAKDIEKRPENQALKIRIDPYSMDTEELEGLSPTAEKEVIEGFVKDHRLL